VARAEDKSLLATINHGDFLMNGFRNRDLQALLYDTEAAPERRRRSAAISRKLRLLRAHGLTHKVPCTHRYHVTEAGRAHPHCCTLRRPNQCPSTQPITNGGLKIVVTRKETKT